MTYTIKVKGREEMFYLIMQLTHFSMVLCHWTTLETCGHKKQLLVMICHNASPLCFHFQLNTKRLQVFCFKLLKLNSPEPKLHLLKDA